MQFGSIGVAVAVAVDDGLVTPVVKEAAAKSLLQISSEVKDLAARAREGKLLPNEFDGGTITVSNLGASTAAVANEDPGCGGRLAGSPLISLWRR